EDVIGRPVDVAEGPDGAIYVSDDYAGAIWRVAYGEEAAGGQSPSATSRHPDPLATLPGSERIRLSRAGEVLYEQFACATCHEPASAGPGIAVKRLEKLDQRYTIESLSLLLETPPQPMPTSPLNPEQRRSLAVHLLETRR
ncbi:MAG: sorbosone dehydrogenase family protein, partial [Myxococcota bacterium]